MAKIPDGWQYLTCERSADDAWGLAIEYKRMREKARSDVFVRVRVVKAAGVHWILRREELREGKLAA